MKKAILAALAALLPCPLFAGVSLPTPVHHWTFNTDGTDVAGGNTMLFTGSSSHAPNCGRFGGGGIKIDKSLSNTGAASSATVNFGTTDDRRTISFWVKAKPGQEVNSTMVGLGLNANGQRFDIKFAAGTDFRVEIQNAGQTTTYNTLADNKWHHVAVTVTQATATMQHLLFYIDGVLITHANTQTQAVNTGTAVVRLGASVIADAGRRFEGWMDDVRIYNVALDIGQIGQIIADADAGGPSASCFAPNASNIILGDSTFLGWDAFTLGSSTLTITNNQNANVIDAKANTTATSGSIIVSPTNTTVYTLRIDGNPVATTTVNVKTIPDLLTFTDSPTLIYGTGNATLNWTTNQALRLEISNDQNATVLTYTASANSQAVLNAGSVVVGPVTTTTVYTLRGWLDEPGAGPSATLQTTVTVQPGPDLTLVASPSVFTGPKDVTLSFNATVIINTTELVNSTIDGFGDGFTLTDSTVNFNTVLGASSSGTHSFVRLTGTNAGTLTNITGWSGNTITVDQDLGSDFTWTGPYRVVQTSTSGADMLVINDGTSNIFTTTDPNVIKNGSFVVTGVNSNKTFTATASISGGGSTMDAVAIVANGTGSTYEEAILADGPVGYYPFNENANSSTVYDHSGNGRHSSGIIGTLTMGQPGALGTAHRFNNNTTITTGVTLDPSDPDLDGGGAADPDTEGFTMEALIRPDIAAAGTNKHILANGNGTGVGRSALYLRNNGQVTTFFGNIGTASSALALDASWCHLVMTITYDPGQARYVARTYLDGALVDTLNMTNAPEPANGAWVIGSHKTRQANNFWQGLLDEVAIYDYALSDAQVAAHNAAFLNNSVGLLAFERSARVLRNKPHNLYVKVGGASSSAFIDNGGGIVTPGTAGFIPVTPSADTTYTLDVDGQMKSVTLQVIDPLFVTGLGTDNGGGFPFVEVDGITPGIYYQMFSSANLLNWSPVGAPFLGVSTTATFLDSLNFNSAARPQYHYRVQDVADPAP